ncbi:MAG: AroM family protein [Armatimonadota bacterium]|nr:AroM family protein [Armatimonadota bacterium]MDR7426324.1 AroM family protein [Armatimonadota bacterium]MDR7463249.1 AroM family protein [Armatimonadota bacterium]MDR7469192.1 AroM family protein [Armatimonadota bacterium]MDR7474743.1 AroM family protein [Armatimonadota bacterium]
MSRLGVLTIGQSPRSDVVPLLAEWLGGEVVEAGALDGLAEVEIAALAPASGEYLLATRLRDGRQVTVSRERILPHIQRALDRLAPQVDVVLLLCTGEFPPLASEQLLIEPSRVLHHVVAGVAGGRRLGVLVPLPAQVEEARRRWQAAGPVAAVAAASPYGNADFSGAGRALREAGAELIVMDCMGYTPGHKRQVVAAAARPVVLAGTAVAAVLRELLT